MQQQFVLSFGYVLGFLKEMPDLERTACLVAFMTRLAERLA